MLIIRHARLVTAVSDLPDTAILIEGNRIRAVGPSVEMPPIAGAAEIDARELLLVPGYIDLQLNGAFGSDFTADPDSIWPVSARLPQFGVTSYLPTVITSPLARIEEARQVVLNGRPANYRGAEPLGLHVEGPFLNPGKKGAHNPAYLRAPDDTAVANWSPATGVRLVTLAPELTGATAVIEELASRGVVVSGGHSLATYAEAQAGFAAGVTYGTHLFNAMPPLGHREPGLVGALLADNGRVAGIIPDGIHVHPAMIQVAWKCKGPYGLNIVSDAMAALGMPPGTYLLNDFEATVTEQECRLADGTLAGSILPLDTAVRNLMTYTACTLAEALATVTITPARLLNLAHERGHIAPGYIADMLLLDQELQVVHTIANGDIVYTADIHKRSAA
jgi:N-acetylglucosamine-6-phosphate deacetylase